MKSKENIKSVIPLSAEAKRKIQKISKQLKGKELFADKNEAARKSLLQIKNLPV